MVREAIFSHLRDLKLSGMLAVYDEVLEEGRRSRSTADKTLLRLLTAESAERRARSHNYRLGQARFPSIKELDSFEFTDTPINEAQVRHLHEGDFAANRCNILRVGGSGTGKTHLSLPLGMALIRQEKRVRFYNVVDLVNELEREKQSGKSGGFEEKISAAEQTGTDVIVIKRPKQEDGKNLSEAEAELKKLMT